MPQKSGRTFGFGVGDVLDEVRRRLDQQSGQHLSWIRQNLRSAMNATGYEPHVIYALTGVGHGTVRGFLESRESGIRNVLLMSLATGFTLAELDRSPEEFAKLLAERGANPTDLPPAAGKARRRR